MYLSICLIVVAAVLYGANLYVNKRNDITALTNEVEKQALALFLYAEKQAWTGEQKMKFAVEKIAERVEDTVLAKVVGEYTVKKWMQDFYDFVKKEIADLK